MQRLSCPIATLRDHYPVVVVGSGYGGAVAASRLARAGFGVCLLERGLEWQPGEYPSTELEVRRQMQAHLPGGDVGSPSGLYEFNLGPDLNVFKGCGLGGGSLVNAGVALRPDPRVFEDPSWPEELRRDVFTLVEAGYQRAQWMLKPAPYPGARAAPAKLVALERSARFLGADFRRPPINVNFSLDGSNHVGVAQHPCSNCGDCVTGCNYAAKNTLIMNYLPDARAHGAEIFTGVSVRSVEHAASGRRPRWLVHCRLLGLGREAFDAPEITVSADLVVLGAGSLGSTEILMRSRQRGLKLSDQLGERLTSNGDIFGFAYDSAQDVNGVGWGTRHDIPPVGPCITGMIDLRGQASLDEGLVIEEGSPPGALAGFLPDTLAASSDALRAANWQATRRGLFGRLGFFGRFFTGPYEGPVRNTQTFLAMGHDSGSGRLTFENDRLTIAWPGLGAEPVFERIRQRLTDATRALEGVLVMNPLWTRFLRHRLITVHPLGGCAMAEDAARGVVNHKGQVFSDCRGATVYENLYVADGAIIPRPLGVNPLLTITALAERTCALIVGDRETADGSQINYSVSPRPVARTSVFEVRGS